MPALTLADEEILEAIKDYWDRDADLTRAAGVLRHGRLKTADTTQPYALVAVRPGTPALQPYAPALRGQPYGVYRLVTVTGYGSREQMVALATLLMAKLAWLPRDDMTLTKIPAGVRFNWTQPADEPRLEEHPSAKEGKDVWTVIFDFTARLTRAIP